MPRAPGLSPLLLGGGGEQSQSLLLPEMQPWHHLQPAPERV